MILPMLIAAALFVPTADDCPKKAAQAVAPTPPVITIPLTISQYFVQAFEDEDDDVQIAKEKEKDANKEVNREAGRGARARAQAARDARARAWQEQKENQAFVQELTRQAQQGLDKADFTRKWVFDSGLGPNYMKSLRLEFGTPEPRRR